MVWKLSSILIPRVFVKIWVNVEGPFELQDSGLLDRKKPTKQPNPHWMEPSTQYHPRKPDRFCQCPLGDTEIAALKTKKRWERESLVSVFCFLSQWKVPAYRSTDRPDAWSNGIKPYLANSSVCIRTLVVNNLNWSTKFAHLHLFLSHQ